MPGLKHEQQIIFNEQMSSWLGWRMQNHFTNYPRSGSKVSVFVQSLGSRQSSVSRQGGVSRFYFQFLNESRAFCKLVCKWCIFKGLGGEGSSVRIHSTPHYSKRSIIMPLLQCCRGFTGRHAVRVTLTHTSRSSTWRWRCAGTADWSPRLCPGRSRGPRGRRKAAGASCSDGLAKTTVGQCS